MEQFTMPAFGETSFFKNRENETAEVVLIEGADEAALARYTEYACACGFCEKERRTAIGHTFVAFGGEGQALFLNYFEHTHELSLVLEQRTAYFEFAAPCGERIVSPQITQVMLEDYGMSYVIRLSDGRFIVIDGGREFEPDATRLYQCLKKTSPDETPVIAAWILSHPHSDHFHCFIKFVELYGTKVRLERVLYNFPSHDDVVHYPKLKAEEQFIKHASPFENIPLMQACVTQMGAATYMPHTGQIYQIGDATCEILATLGDTVHASDNINATSLVIRMELGGQVILWTTDASFSIAKLPQRYGAYLKADILQIPHHGFQSGTAAGEIAGYDLIAPTVCFLPVSDYHAYTSFCTYREGTAHIMQKPTVEEIITGDKQRTVMLPYRLLPGARVALERAFRTGRDQSGALCWIFSDLNTASAEDLTFTLLNTTYLPAKVRIDLYFEDKSENVECMIATLPGRSLKTVSLVGGGVETETRFYNPASRDHRGIPENKPFAVRLLSDLPIVVTNQNHKADYISSNN